MIQHIDQRYGPEARNRSPRPPTPTAEGAHAALESFHYAPNHRDNAALHRSPPSGSRPRPVR
jgi:hypothetical protein